MQNNVTPSSRPRILAMRARHTIRIPLPAQTVIVPIIELPQFLALARVVAARHQRAAAHASNARVA